MDDDIDIYEDLPSFDAKESEKYKEEIKDLSQKCNDFQQENTELKLKVAELLESNESLSVNLSSLLKTAKAEVSRKDRMITELRQQLDNMAFRRSGYIKPKAQEFSKKSAKNNTYTPAVRQEPFPVYPDQAVPYQKNTFTPFIQEEQFPVPPNQPTYQELEEEIEDPEQKYEPEKIATTVFGERLRKKILLEQEVERIQKEEAKRAMLENKATTVKTEVKAIQENENAINLVKDELKEEPNSFVEEAALSIKSAPASNGSSLNSYEEDDRNLAERRELSNKLLGKRFSKDVLFPQQKRRRIEEERYHSDDTRYYNGNAQHENRSNQESNDQRRKPRNTAKHISRRRGSDNREDFEDFDRGRRVPGERSKSNHRSRSRSPDRRHVEKRADRHRTDKYRAYMDKCEKRRHNGLNRNNAYSNKFNKDAYDLREKIDHRVESNTAGRNEYNNYKNSKLDEERKRERRESPPPVKSRSRSNGRIRVNPVHKIGGGRSKSSNRLTNIWDEASESKNVKSRLKEIKSSVDGREEVIDEFKLEKSPRTSCERETTNEQLVSTAPLPDVSEKKGTDKEHISTTLLPNASASIPKSDEVTEDLRKLRKGVKTKPKDPVVIENKDRGSEPKSRVSSKASSEKDITNKQIASSQLLPDTSGKEVTDPTLTSTAQLPNVSSSAPKTCEVPEELKKQLKIAGRRSKDSEPVPEQKNRDSVSKMQISARKSFEKEMSYKLLVSLELLPDVSKKNVTNQQVVSTSQLPGTSVSAPESYDALEIFKKRKGARRKSKDPEPAIAEQKSLDPDPKSQIKSKQSPEKEVTKQLDSPASLPEVSKKDLENQQPVSTNPVGSAPASESNEVPEEIKRERKGARRKSKDPEPSITEQENRDSKAKSQLASRKSSDKELINKRHTSSAPFPDASTNEVTIQQLAISAKLPDDLTSAEKLSEVPDERKKQRKSSRTKTKDPAVNDHKDRNSKSKSPPTRTSSEKEVANKKLAATEVSNVPNIASCSRDEPEEVKKQQKRARRKSKDPKPTVTEEKECNSILKYQSPTKPNSEKTATNEHLVSCEPSVEDLISKLESDGISDEQKALNDENTKPGASHQIVPNKVDNPGEWISSVLENDAEILSIPLETSTDVGSRSFREEKIENIEKFILNYQDDEDLCCRIPKRSTEDLDCGNKSCDSTSSILDTLSMDIDVVANCKPGGGVLDNSLISEQLLLESLSTPVKKNSPLPPLPPPDVIKPPPLPPNSPPEEIKQPPLPPNPPPEESKQPPLPPDSPPEEMRIQSLPLLPSSDKNQRNSPPHSSPDEKKQYLPPLPSPDEEKQTLPPLPSPDKKKQNLSPFTSAPEEEKQNVSSFPSSEKPEQNLPPFPAPEEKKQSVPPFPSPEEKKQSVPPHPYPVEKKQTLPSPFPPNESKQSPPSLSSPNKNQLSPLPSDETVNQVLPSLSSSDKGKQPTPSLTSSGDKKQRLSSPHPSPDHKKRRLLSSLLSLDEKEESPSPPLPTVQEKAFAPVSKEDTKPNLLFTQKKTDQAMSPTSIEKTKLNSLLTQKKTDQSLSPIEKTKPNLLLTQKKTDQTLSPTSIEKTKPALLTQSTSIAEIDLPSSLPPALKEGENPELSAIPVQSKNDDLLLSQVGSEIKNSQSASLPALPEKAELPLSLPPDGSETENLQVSGLPVPSKKKDLHLSLSATAGDKSGATSSHSLAPVNEKLHPTAPPDKKSQSLAPLDKKWCPPTVADKKSQHPAIVHNKSPSPAPLDRNPQPPVPIGKKPEPPTVVDDKQQHTDPTYEKSQPLALVDNKTQHTDPTDKKSQHTDPTDKKSQPLVPADKKSEPPHSVVEKSLVPAGSEKLNPPLAATEESSLLPAPSEKKDQPPAPTDKNTKISETKETSTRKPDPEKPRLEKVTLKAISRRHRISCTPIVSRYSRKTRDLVLTDSDASLCVSKSDASSDNESNNNANTEIKISPSITKEAKIILQQIETEFKDTSSENGISNPVLKIAKPEKLSTAVNISSPENARKIKSDIPKPTSELPKTRKVEPAPEIIPPTLCNIEIQNSEHPENNSGESQSQLKSKQEASPKPQNQETNSQIEKPSGPKTSESRGTRSALKTITTPDPGGDSSSVSANRKKPLPKEKENQSKPVAKPSRIMVVARRRRPVTLEDSSTATTLVTSAQETNCDRLSKSNSIKNTQLNSEKPEVVQTLSDPGKGRKRRSADK